VDDKTWRDGYVPGKKKTTLYLDNALHKALRIRAAETGESMGQITERALRKELCMMDKRTTIDLDEVRTTYSTGRTEHEAILLPWAVVTDILGREHRGTGEDDALLVDVLLQSGAPEWVRTAEGWTDEYGWGLIGPELAVIESQGDYHNVSLIIGSGRLEVHGGFDKAAAWEAALAEAAERYDPDELYSIAVADAARDIADALEAAGICGAAQVDDDGPAGARVTATLGDGRRIVIIVDGAASDTGRSVSVHDVTPVTPA
jgi:hypothetical protein